MTVTQHKVGEKPLTIFRPDGMFDLKAVDQIENCLKSEHATAGALMADHHLGYSMPIGGVIAYEGAISPSGVGFDIACGNMAVQTNLNMADFDTSKGLINTFKPFMREIQKKVAFGVGRSNPEPVDHPLFESEVWPHLEALSPGLKTLAEKQLGTVGSGNHYVDLLVDEEGNLWIANHFGSRGLGHKIASGFLNLAANKYFTDHAADTEEPTVISLDSNLGLFYLAAMELAGQYAYAGREYVIRQVLSIFGATAVFSVHNHHNYAWLENGQWVVRKGATPLTREPAFIGGSMGDPSVIVRGAPTPEGGMIGDKSAVVDLGNLGSAPHGAGRVMSRTKAAGKLRKMWYCGNRNCTFEPIRSTGTDSPHKGNRCPNCDLPLRKGRLNDGSGLIDWDAVRQGLNERGIVVLGAGADEAPGVYKTLEGVLAVHQNIQVVKVLEPLGVVMAGADEFDPYVD